MSFFRAVIYLLIRSKIYQYIAYQRKRNGGFDFSKLLRKSKNDKQQF